MSPDITWSEPYHAASGSAERCNVMARQFDFAVKWHEHAPKLKQAKLLRTQGVNLCASGEQTEGMAKLEQALGDLGIQPQS